MENFDLRKYLAENRLLKENIDEGRMKDPSGSIKMGKYPQVSSDTPVPMNVKYLTTNGEKLTMKVQAKNRKEAVDAVKSKDPNFKAEIKTDFVYDKDGNKLLKEELTWFIDDENTDVRYENDAYLKEVGDKIKELHPDISSEDLNKIIIMTGEQYSREEDFHGDSIPSNNFVEAAVEIYQTDVLGSDGEDDEDFDRWAPENLDGDFPKDSRFAGWTQAQYDTYQEDPYTYLKDKTNPRLK